MFSLYRLIRAGLLCPLLALQAPLTFAESPSPTPDKTRADVTALLKDFLAPGKNDKAETHERFWADDLVYTTSGGVVKTKADIRQSFIDQALPVAAKTNPAIAPPPASTVYSAEDILVRPYGNMAALTFRLVARESSGAVSYFRNSGTFLYRDGQWRAITWQATKVPAGVTQPAPAAK